MLFGAIVKSDKETEIQNDEGDILHISQACLGSKVQNGRTTLQVKYEGKTLNLCHLTKGTCEQVYLDINLSTNSDIKLCVEGLNDIHVTGYLEPERFCSEDLDLDDDEEEARKRALKVAKEVSKEKDEDKSEGNTENESCHSEDDLEEDSHIEDTDGEKSDQQSGNEDSDGDEFMEAIKKVKGKLNPINNKKERGTKRPATFSSKPAKKTKDNKEESYLDSVVQYLKSNGKTAVSILGSHVKKPKGVNKKLGQILKDNTSIIKVEAGIASLR